MGREAKAVKDRKYWHCKQVVTGTAEDLKAHAAQCGGK